MHHVLWEFIYFRSSILGKRVAKTALRLYEVLLVLCLCADGFENVQIKQYMVRV